MHFHTGRASNKWSNLVGPWQIRKNLRVSIIQTSFQNNHQSWMNLLLEERTDRAYQHNNKVIGGRKVWLRNQTLNWQWKVSFGHHLLPRSLENLRHSQHSSFPERAFQNESQYWEKESWRRRKTSAGAEGNLGQPRSGPVARMSPPSQLDRTPLLQQDSMPWRGVFHRHRLRFLKDRNRPRLWRARLHWHLQLLSPRRHVSTASPKSEAQRRKFHNYIRPKISWELNWIAIPNYPYGHIDAPDCFEVVLLDHGGWIIFVNCWGKKNRDHVCTTSTANFFTPLHEHDSGQYNAGVTVYGLHKWSMDIMAMLAVIDTWSFLWRVLNRADTHKSSISHCRTIKSSWLCNDEHRMLM